MNTDYQIPISVKGIVLENEKVWLRKNERNEWELPGGKMDEGEQPEETVVRELEEELGFKIKPEKLLSTHFYKITISKDEIRNVLVIIYLCTLIKKTGKFEDLGEAGKAEFNCFSSEEIENLNMPQFYKEAIGKTLAVERDAQKTSGK